MHNVDSRSLFAATFRAMRDVAQRRPFSTRVGVLASVIVLAIACTDAVLPTAPEVMAPASAVMDESETTGATVTTDKDDYWPGEIVTITGAGFWPNEAVDLVLEEEPQTHDPRLWDVTADENGGFVDDSFSPESHDLGVTFTLTATGRESGLVAQHTFTDGLTGVRTNGPTGLSVAWRRFTANTTCSGTPASTGTATPVGTTNVNVVSIDVGHSIEFTAPPVAGYVFDGWSVNLDNTIVSATAVTCFAGVTDGVRYRLNYSEVVATKLAFITGPFNERVGDCMGPMQVQAQDDEDEPVAVTSDLTVTLATDQPGGFFSNNDCSSSTTTTQIDEDAHTSDEFWYRPTGRGANLVAAGNPPSTGHPDSYGIHELSASNVDLETATQEQTVKKALTTLIYTGDRIVFVGNTFTFSALLSSGWEPCTEDKGIIFRIIPHPVDQSAFFQPSAPQPETNDDGVATRSVPTTGWDEDIYDARASFSGDNDCEASKDDYTVSVLTPGGAATGGGFLAGYKVDGGRANFGFTVRPIVGSDPIAYKGQFLLIRQNGGVPQFRCKGPIDVYGIVEGSSPLLNVASGRCDFQVWNPSLNYGEGGWVVPYGDGYTNRQFIIQFIDNGTGKGKNAPDPDEFGFSINFVGLAIPDPSFDIAPINGGNIDVKDSGGSSPTGTGETAPTSPKGGGKKK